MKRILLPALLFLVSSAYAQWFNWEARMGNSNAEMQSMNLEMSRKGFTPGILHTLYHNGETYYSSIWKQYPENAAWEYRSGLDVDGLQEMADEFSNRGYVPVDVSVYKVNGATRFTALWSRDEHTLFQTWVGIRADEFKSRIDSFTSLGYRLTDIDGYVENGQRYFSGIWKRFSDLPWQYVFGYNENDFKQSIKNAADNGYVPTAINVFEQDGNMVFSAVMVSSPNEKAQVVYRVHESILQSFVDEKIGEGYAITDVDSYILDGEVNYAMVLMKAIHQNPVQRPIANVNSGDNSIPVSQSGSRQLAIAPVQQQTLVWCWLAVGEMIFRHFDIPNLNPGGNYQCGIIGSLNFVSGTCASNCFNNACIIPSGSNYNTARMLRDYTWTAANKVFNCIEGREMSFDAISQNIDQGKPILAGISYTRRLYYGGAEHAVLITGYERNASGTYLVINDPFPYGSSNNPYLREGGRLINNNQYKISLEGFTERIFWHWSLSGISIL